VELADADVEAPAALELELELELELDELEQAASTGPAKAARPPAISRRRRSRPAAARAGVFLVAIESEVPLSLICMTARPAAAGCGDAKEGRFPVDDAGMSRL
jgi:hypothetical protein